MVVVAVAGGTGNVGRTIVEALLATGKHHVKILSRKPDPALEAEIGASILPVDYADVDFVAKTLEKNNVHTVISGIAMHSVDGSVPSEIDLIRAAEKSKTTKRMIASSWGSPVPEDLIGDIPATSHKINARKELEKTEELEWAVVHNGYFMDYWGIPIVKSHMARTPVVMWLDIPNNAAAIPGSGNTPNVFTHTTDVAKFVAASLDLPKWEHDLFVRGDRLTWNEFLRHAEDAKGTKFSVTYDSLDKLQAGQVTELPGHVALYQYFPKQALQGIAAAFGIWFERGVMDLKPAGGKFLNEEFPGIKPMTVQEMLEKAWKKS